MNYEICYISKNIVGFKLNYMVIEKQLLVMVHVVNNFRHYIIGYHIFLRIDHAAIRYLMNKIYVRRRFIGWILLLQKFDITIVDKP